MPVQIDRVDGVVRGMHGCCEGAVGVDDEPGEQVVAAVHVAVDTGADHTEAASDAPQADPRGALGGQVLPSD